MVTICEKKEKNPLIFFVTFAIISIVRLGKKLSLISAFMTQKKPQNKFYFEMKVKV